MSVEAKAEKPSIEQLDPTAILFAEINKKNLKQIKRCIKEGANVNARNEAGLTPLELAFNLEDTLDLFSRMLKISQIRNTINEEVLSKFMLQLFKENNEEKKKTLVDVLAKRGVAYIRKAEQKTPPIDERPRALVLSERLFEMVAKEDATSLEQLLRNTGFEAHRNKEGKTAITLALTTWNYEKICWMTKHPIINEKMTAKEAGMVISVFIENNNVEGLSRIFQDCSKPNSSFPSAVNQANEEGIPPLFKAALAKNEEMIQLLMNYKADYAAVEKWYRALPKDKSELYAEGMGFLANIKEKYKKESKEFKGSSFSEFKSSSSSSSSSLNPPKPDATEQLILSSLPSTYAQIASDLIFPGSVLRSSDKADLKRKVLHLPRVIESTAESLSSALFRAVNNQDVAMVLQLISDGAPLQVIDKQTGATALALIAGTWDSQSIALLAGSPIAAEQINVEEARLLLCSLIDTNQHDALSEAFVYPIYSHAVNKADSCGITPLFQAARNQKKEIIALLIHKEADYAAVKAWFAGLSVEEVRRYKPSMDFLAIVVAELSVEKPAASSTTTTISNSTSADPVVDTDSSSSSSMSSSMSRFS